MDLETYVKVKLPTSTKSMFTCTNLAESKTQTYFKNESLPIDIKHCKLTNYYKHQ
jgi:hypothetical protein